MYASGFNGFDRNRPGFHDRLSGKGYWLIGIAIVLVMIFAPLIAGAITNDDKALRTARQMGYTDVTIVDKSVYFIQWRGCAEDDSALYTVKGTGPDGEVREIEICAGVFKGGTHRG